MSGRKDLSRLHIPRSPLRFPDFAIVFLLAQRTLFAPGEHSGFATRTVAKRNTERVRRMDLAPRLQVPVETLTPMDVKRPEAVIVRAAVALAVHGPKVHTHNRLLGREQPRRCLIDFDNLLQILVYFLNELSQIMCPAFGFARPVTFTEHTDILWFITCIRFPRAAKMCLAVTEIPRLDSVRVRSHEHNRVRNTPQLLTHGDLQK